MRFDDKLQFNDSCATARDCGSTAVLESGTACCNTLRDDGLASSAGSVVGDFPNVASTSATARDRGNDALLENGTACYNTLRHEGPASSAAPALGAASGVASSGTLDARLARPLRVMFMQTDMRVGGAEMVTADLIRRLDRDRFQPELCCLKELGEIGATLTGEIRVHCGLLRNKYDLRVLPRLITLLRTRKIDAVITVGAGDKMFWGRLAARRLGLPVVISALHTTGWPDGVGRLNRMLTPITDAFIAVAASHGEYLVEHEGFPANRVVVIPNGVDMAKYAPLRDPGLVRRELGIDADAPVVGIVAALRPEKNHELFLELARRVVRQLPNARFLIVGDGMRRDALEQRAAEMGLESSVLFLGSRHDVPCLLAAMDVFALTSHNEANPISILEAMGVARPVVATNVGSIHEAVAEGETGYLVPAGDSAQLTDRVMSLLKDEPRRLAMGSAAREAVADRWSIDAMVSGYEQLIETIYARKLERKCDTANA